MVVYHGQLVIWLSMLIILSTFNLFYENLPFQFLLCRCTQNKNLGENNIHSLDSLGCAARVNFKFLDKPRQKAVPGWIHLFQFEH